MAEQVDNNNGAAQEREGKPERRRLHGRQKTAEKSEQSCTHEKANSGIKQENHRSKKQKPHYTMLVRF